MLPLHPSPTKKHTVLPMDYHAPSNVLCWTFEALHNLACPTQPSMLSFSITQCALLFPLIMSKSGPFPGPVDIVVQLVYCPWPWTSCKSGHFYFHDLLFPHCLSEFFSSFKTSLSHNVFLTVPSFNSLLFL